jgi:hypothetical protein
VVGCACRARQLRPAGSRSELSYPWAGVLVLGSDYETYSELAAGNVLQAHGHEVHAFHRGAFDFLHTLGSPFLHNRGLRLLRAAHAVLETRGEDDTLVSEFIREADGLAEPRPLGISCADLLDSATEVEANRLATSPEVALGLRTPADMHRELLDRLGEGADSPRRRGYEWLAARMGDDDAYDLLPLLTFLAFVTQEPCEMFERLADAAAADPETWKSMSSAQLLDRLEWSDPYDSYWDMIAAREPVGTPYVADTLIEAMTRLGRSLLLELLARPTAYLSQLPEPQLRGVLPPVIVYSAREGGLVHHLNGVALDVDETFASNALADVAAFGAAERLSLAKHGQTSAYCYHDGCPHHESALCHRWFSPPTTDVGHDACHFITVFEHHAGTDPATAWNAVRAH